MTVAELKIPNYKPDPSHPVFGNDSSPFPSWVKSFRDPQWEAACQIVDAFSRGKKVVMLDAPTGSGKTLVAEMVRRMLGTKALYVCSTKTLQDQFAKDFPYSAVIKGRANYPTADFPERFHLENPAYRLTAADCVNTKSDGITTCPWCTPWDAGLYEVAKRYALASELAVMNTAYWLTDVNGPGNFKDYPLVVIDEADTLESTLMGHISVVVSPRVRKKLSIDRPYVKTISEKTGAHRKSWSGWAGNAKRTIEKHLKSKRLISNDVVAIREMKSLSNIVNKLERLEVEALNDGWIYTDYSTNTKNKGDDYSDPVVFKPIQVCEQAPDVAWSRGKRFLLMSATLLSGEQSAECFGLKDDEWEIVFMPSSFPVENRPIFVTPKGNMTNKFTEQEAPKLIKGIEAIMASYPDERILVHTVSYSLSNRIASFLKDKRIVTYQSAAGRDDALRDFLSSKNSVLLASSFERGVDLRDDDCRVVIIAKVPYPNLGDKQISARLYTKGGNEWYHLQTIRSVIQMSGRGVRHEKDWADTYILDAQFMNIFRKRQRWFPKWWRDAINWSDRKSRAV